MIKSFRHRGLRAYFTTGKANRLPVQNHARVGRMLRALDDASVPRDMNLPGYRFHALGGDRAGTYSVTVTANWRITFGWDVDGAIDVDMEDYH